MKASTILLLLASTLLVLFAAGFIVLFGFSTTLPMWVTMSEYVGGGSAILAGILILLPIIAWKFKLE